LLKLSKYCYTLNEGEFALYYSDLVAHFLSKKSVTVQYCIDLAKICDSNGTRILSRNANIGKFLSEAFPLKDVKRVADLKDSEGRTIFRNDEIEYKCRLDDIRNLLKTGISLKTVERLVSEVVFDSGATVFQTPRDIIRFLKSGGDLEYAQSAIGIRDHEGREIFNEFTLGLCKENGFTILQLRQIVDISDTESHTIFSDGEDVYAVLRRDQLKLDLVSLRNTEEATVFRDGADINRFVAAGGTYERGSEYVSVRVNGATAFNGHDIAVLQSNGVPADYTQKMVEAGLNADTIIYYYKLGLKSIDIDFKNDGRPKALFLYPTDDPTFLGDCVFSEERAINVISIIKDHYDIKLRAISTVEEMCKCLDEDSDLKLLVLGGHGSRETLTFGCSRPKYGIHYSDDSRELKVSKFNLKEHLRKLPEDLVIFLDSCLNGEGGAEGENMANYVAQSAPGRKVISSMVAFNGGDICFHSFIPFDIDIFKHLKRGTYIPENGWRKIKFSPTDTLICSSMNPDFVIGVNNRGLSFPFLHLPNNPTRERFYEMIERARSSLIMNEIVSGFDLELIESRDYCDDCNTGYFGLEYVFYKRFMQPWAANGKASLFLYYNDSLTGKELIPPFPFLFSKGFRPVDYPLNGDVVAYFLRKFDRPEYFGIYDDGRVISKLGFGHIVRHDLSLVPYSEYTPTDSVAFLRYFG